MAETHRSANLAVVKPYRRFRSVILGAGLALFGATSVYAQLIHLAFSESESWSVFKANSIHIPWNLTGGRVDRLDIYYDLSSAVNQGDGAYRFTDPARNVWRAIVRHRDLGTFEIIRPLTKLTLWEDSMMFEHTIGFSMPTGSAVGFCGVARSMMVSGSNNTKSAL